MDPTQFQVVPSPSYAAPIVNWFGQQNQKQQPQQNQQNQQQQNQQQNWGAKLRAWLQQQSQQGQQTAGDPALAIYNNPNLTMRQRVGLDPVDPGSMAGANTLTAGLY